MCRLVVAGLALMGALFVPAAQAEFGDSQKVISVFSEVGDKAKTSGFSLGLRNVDRTDFYMQLGLSYQRITLKQQPADYNDGRIRPLFLYGRLGMDWRVSPYFQAGFDLNGSLIEWVDSSNDICCHAMVRTGLELKVHDNIRLDIYGNWYNLQYRSYQQQSNPFDYQDNGDNQRFSRTTVGAQLSLVF
ncbi:hypothetical protein ORJ04_16825 [Rheinheimera baltica]|uniref:Outer membrane protein beta-barrel domain-containing protein n=1 Tax=Rheinheimera baltica TaxID=67576 RepID=A0ABT9I2K3_9GAMM|nr:hypothetical protein [Rheinheimera baltica]MDP5137622.1 hypothetical protein [Rheinheimera baltica]